MWLKGNLAGVPIARQVQSWLKRFGFSFGDQRIVEYVQSHYKQDWRHLMVGTICAALMQCTSICEPGTTAINFKQK